MSGTQVSSQGQLTCDLLRALARVSTSIRAKRKRSLLDEWVSNLSHVELSDSCYEMSQGESWVEVKDILILHSVTSTSQRGIPVLLLLNNKGKLIQANDTTLSNCMFGLDMNPDVYRMKYYEKELMSNLWVTLKLNKCRGGDVSIEKSTDLVGLMKALSDGNCFTREPVHHKGQMIVPWLQELPRFTAGQYLVALLERELWARWIRSGAEGTKANTCTVSEGIHASAAAKGESSEHKSATLTRIEQNYSNVNIVQTAVESFTATDYHKSESTSSSLFHQEVIDIVRESARRGMAHELVQSFLEIVKTKDHEKLIFIIGTTQKRCINGQNSVQAMKFYKKSIEAAKLWTIIYLLECQSAVSFSKASYNTKASQATDEASVFSPGRFRLNIAENTSDSIHASRSMTRQIAESIVSIPLLESLSPFHELKAIFCTRFLTIGANCFAEQLIQDEKNVSENSVMKKKKKKVKKKKNFTPESHRLGSKGTGEAIVTSPTQPVCVGSGLHSLLNISISPHLLTPHLIERSEACIFIGRWVDELVDSATSLSHSLSPCSFSPTTSFATLSSDVDFNGNHDDILVVEGTPVTAIECQLQRECEAETERLLEEEFYFPCSPIDVDCTEEEEEEEDRDEDGLTPPSSQPLGYTGSDTIVRSTILTTSSRDSWSDMALFQRLHAYDSKTNVTGAEEAVQETEMTATAHLSATSYGPSGVAEVVKVDRSEEGEEGEGEGEGGRGGPGYLSTPSDVFGGWALDNISGEKRTSTLLFLSLYFINAQKKKHTHTHTRSITFPHPLSFSHYPFPSITLTISPNLSLCMFLCLSLSLPTISTRVSQPKQVEHLYIAATAVDELLFLMILLEHHTDPFYSPPSLMSLSYSGGPHLGPYYSEGTGVGAGGGSGYAPYGECLHVWLPDFCTLEELIESILKGSPRRFVVYLNSSNDHTMMKIIVQAEAVAATILFMRIRT
jgi:hypothetical protein